jgi:hypothetical protein
MRGGHDRCPECGSATAAPSSDQAPKKRKPSLTRVVFVVGALVIAIGPSASALVRQLQAIHYLSLANALESSGACGEESLESSISRYGGDLEVQTKALGDPPAIFGADICFVRNGKELVKIQGHSGTVFVRHGNILVYAAYNQISCGCTLVAVELQSGKTLWETDVGGFMVQHSVYRNRVRLTFRDDMVVVWGEELPGVYVSIVEISSGRLLAQRVFPGWN